MMHGGQLFFQCFKTLTILGLCVLLPLCFCWAEAEDQPLSELIQTVKTGDYHAVWKAVEAIKDRGTEAAAAIPALRKLQKEIGGLGFHDLEMLIDIAVNRIDPKAVERATKLLETANNAADVIKRIQALQELAKIGPRVNGVKKLL